MKGILYKFYCWENGKAAPTRIINHTSDRSIKAIYAPISRERSVNQRLYELRKLEFSVELQKLLQDEVRELRIDVNSMNYYPSKDLQILKEPYEISEESPFFMLKRRLEECPTGKENWRKYQDASLAIIVDCKNSSNELKPNNVVITSKYFGRKRLGLFGIIVTRKGLRPNAKEEQKRLWNEDDKMIICLNDLDLIKILELKERGEKPYKVIDEAIRSFHQSLSSGYA